MSQPLIRPEVFAARRAQWLGEVRLGLPSVLNWLVLIAVMAAGVLLLLLTFGSYTRRASVQGEIVPAAGLLRLDANSAGVVSALYVDEGSVVRAGQTLMLINVGQSSAAMGDAATLVAGQLSAQAERLDRTLHMATLDSERARRALQQQLAALVAERRLIESQQALRTRQLQQARAALERVAPLQSSGVLARRQIEEYEQAVLNAEDALNETELRLLAHAGRSREISEQLAAQPASALTNDTQLRGERATLTQVLAQAQAQSVQRIVAPRDGVVTGLGVQLGQSVVADRRLLTLIPADSVLVAQLWVPSSAIGQLAQGDRVMLRLDAFPHQRFGRVQAIVERVDATAMAPQEIRRIADRAPDYPAFRVIARLPAATPAMPLRASMSLAGDLQLERRRLIQWIYAPLLAATGVTP